MPIPYLSIGAALASSVFNYIGAQQQRKQAIKDQDNQYVRMRNAAQRAGFNPLTVMRLTGGQGFTGLPTISKAAAFGNAALGVFDAFKNAPIEKYKEKVRDLTVKDMSLDILLKKASLASLRSRKGPVTGGVLTAGKNAKDLSVGLNAGKISKEEFVPGTGQTLDEIFENQPMDNRVMKTADGSYVSDTVGAALKPMVTPGGNVIYVPWDPDDADIGAIAGGTVVYGGTKAYDAYKNFSFGNLLKKFDGMSDKEFEIRRQMLRMN